MNSHSVMAIIARASRILFKYSLIIETVGLNIHWPYLRITWLTQKKNQKKINKYK